jgi:LysR family glycine cleavage system transcriptional activator
MLNDPGMRLPLNQLRVFATVAHCENFSQAAEVLNVSAAAVSAQIRALEEYLKTPLFVRGARNIRLTAAGELLLPGVQRALEEIRTAFERVREHEGQAPLRVSVLASFLQRWLLPRIAGFYETWPEVPVLFHTGLKPVDFGTTDVQLAIRLGGGRWARLRAEKLFDEWLMPACAPRVARELGSISLSQALRRVPLIESPTESWARYLESMRVASGGLKVSKRADDSLAVTEAACQGHGLALVRWSLARPDIESGRLVTPLGGALKYWFAYYAVAPAGNLTLGNVRLFLEWLQREAAGWSPPS